MFNAIMHNPASAVVLSTLVAKTTIPLPWFLASSSLSTPRHHQSLNSATALCKIRYVTKEEIPWGWLSIPLRLSVPWWVWQPWLAPQSPFFLFISVDGMDHHFDRNFLTDMEVYYHWNKSRLNLGVMLRLMLIVAPIVLLGPCENLSWKAYFMLRFDNKSQPLIAE